MTADREIVGIANTKTNVRMALVEKSQQYIEYFLDKIEKKIDKLDSKIDKVETKIYNNFKWFLGISLTGIISIASMGFTIYQYVKH